MKKTQAPNNSFLWSKTNNSLKAVKTTATFTHGLKKTRARKSDNLASYFLLIIVIFFIVL